MFELAVSTAPSPTSSTGISPIAVLALIVSLLALAWNIGLSVLRLPRLRAEMNMHVIASGEPKDYGYEYHVRAINVGAEPVTIWDVGLGSGWREDNTAVSVSAARIDRRGNRHVLGPALPARIEGHEVLSWTFTHNATMGEARPGDEIHGWIERYRPRRIGRYRYTRRAIRRRARRYYQRSGPRYAISRRLRALTWPLQQQTVRTRTSTAEYRGTPPPPE